MKFLTRTTNFVERNASTILSFVSVCGVVTTAVLAVKATPKALLIIDKEKEETKKEKLTKIEIVKATWECYIPSIMVGGATIACIVSANVLNKKQQTVLTSAYAFLDQQYKLYRKKVNELFGDDADNRVQDAIVKEKCDDEPHQVSNDVVLFYEENYGKIFERRMIEVRDAEYNLNRLFATIGQASLNDFYDLLGLEKTETGETLGWSQDYICDFYTPGWIDFQHRLVTLDDGMECYVIDMPIPPTIDYDLPF